MNKSLPAGVWSTTGHDGPSRERAEAVRSRLESATRKGLTEVHDGDMVWRWQPLPTTDRPAPGAGDHMTPQKVAEYAVWYARKVKGPAAKVAAALLEEFPWLREPLERAVIAPGAGEAAELAGLLEAMWNQHEDAADVCGFNRATFDRHRDLIIRAALAAAKPSPEAAGLDAERLDAERLEQAISNATAALGREWDGLYSWHAPHIAAAYRALSPAAAPEPEAEG